MASLVRIFNWRDATAEEIDFIFFLIFIFTILNVEASTLSCSFLDNFNSDKIKTFFYKRENKLFSYHVDGLEKYKYSLLDESEKKIVIGHFNSDFDSIFIFNKIVKTFKMTTIYSQFSKNDKQLSGKCEVIN